MNLLVSLTTIYLPLLVIVYLIVKKDRVGLNLLLVSLITLGVNFILKETFKIDGAFSQQGFRISEYSFPSLSTQLAATFWGYLFLEYKRPVLLILAITIVVVVGYYKLLNAEHGIIDIIGGALIGIAVSLIFYRYAGRKRHDQGAENHAE